MDEDIRTTSEAEAEFVEDVKEDIADDTAILGEEFKEEPTDFILEEDLDLLKKDFSELQDISDISQLPNPTRYAALRDLGLTPKEAYLATSPIKKTDTRSHLKTGVPHISKSPVSSMTRREWQVARALFEDMNDSDIEKLYRKVTK